MPNVERMVRILHKPFVIFCTMAIDRMSKRTTTDAGIPAPSDEYSLTSGEQGSVLLQDHYLVQKMAHFSRERVPERVVHAKGAGAHGIFECSEDMSDYTCALPFKKGTRDHRRSCCGWLRRHE